MAADFVTLGGILRADNPGTERTLVTRVEGRQTLRTLRNVVVVDDSPVLLRAMTDMVSGVPDVVPWPFRSSREAVAWSANHDVDCFVLDYYMPEPDGLEMTRMIRLDPRLGDVPIVIVTGESDPAVRTNVLRTGANDYITKPVQPLELAARLTTLLALHAARKTLALRVDQLESSLVTAERRSRSHAARLEALWRVGNNPTLHGDARIEAMLRHAASAIRPPFAFRGLLGRLDADEVELIALSAPPDDDPRAGALKLGTRRRISDTIVALVVRTLGWDDMAALQPVPPLISQLGWRSVIATRFIAGESHYAMTFASTAKIGEPFDADDYAYVELLAAFFANQLAVVQLERSLRDSEQRSRQHAERLETLSRIVNNPALGEEERLDTMLREAATSIRPGQSFRGMLVRVDDADVVLEAYAEPVEVDVPGNALVEIGNRRPIAGALGEELMRAGRGTAAWDDVIAPGGPRAHEHGSTWRAFICTAFRAAGATHVLAFGSPEPSREPFGPQDAAYLEIIASFFANHLQQRWQFDRLRYEQHHDSLTGLLNRSQFRSRGRSACLGIDRFAILLVDIARFREVNETHGYMIGDALLVEVSSALRATARDDELAGRLGGDVFALCLPGADSGEAKARAARVAAIFERPFSTGDREHQQFVQLAGRLGVAAAPEDGTAFEDVLARAEAALDAAKRRA